MPVEPLAEFFVSTFAAGSYLPAGWSLSDRFSANRESPNVAAGELDLAFEKDEDDKDRRSKSATGTEDMDSTTTPARKKAGASGVGSALREAYQEALREDVPPEMLDLLGKLG